MSCDCTSDDHVHDLHANLSHNHSPLPPLLPLPPSLLHARATHPHTPIHTAPGGRREREGGGGTRREAHTAPDTHARRPPRTPTRSRRARAPQPPASKRHTLARTAACRLWMRMRMTRKTQGTTTRSSKQQRKQQMRLTLKCADGATITPACPSGCRRAHGSVQSSRAAGTGLRQASARERCTPRASTTDLATRPPAAPPPRRTYQCLQPSADY